ncbi:MAG: YqzL family protein [Senegalia sp. (in: firmicutes)]
MASDQLFWQLFKLTGSINAYLMYKNLSINS